MKSILLFVAAAAFALMPLAIDFNGFDPDAYPIPQTNPPAQPAGYAFSIWIVIYAWLLASAAVGLSSRAENEAWDRMRWPLIGSLVIGAAWLPVAEVSPVWATILIWAMLVLALVALFRTPSDEDRLLLRAPLGLYAGWLTAASWVSVALLAAGFGIGPGAYAWAIIVTVLALATAAWVLFRLRPAQSYGIAVIWALVAIAVKSAQSETFLAILAGAGAMAILALMVLRLPAD